MRASYRLYPLIALGLLAGASIWLERLSRVDETRPIAISGDTPDFIAENTRIVGFGQDGKQRYALVADRLTHLPASDRTLVDAPRLELDNQGRRLTIHATSGEVASGAERVDFRGDVVAWRAAAPGGSEMTFRSEHLTVWPDDHRAETQQALKLTQGATTAEALGMRADNLFGTLDLIGQARVQIPRRQGSKS